LERYPEPDASPDPAFELPRARKISNQTVGDL
jgi:hypothetical protein